MAPPNGVGLAEQHTAGPGRGIVHLAARLDDAPDPVGHPCRVPVRTLAYLAMGGRIETQPLDVDLDLVGPNGSGRIEALGGLRQTPAGSRTRSAPSCCLMSLAENSLPMNDR